VVDCYLPCSKQQRGKNSKSTKKRHGIQPGWNDAPQDDDESDAPMVAFGGIVPDNEADDVERNAIESRVGLGQKAEKRSS
jgi:hypothetical protein